MERAASSEKSGSSNSAVLQKKQPSVITDFAVLDCPVCVEPFTIPIFQCDNGHLACSSCCPKLSNKCPSCALPIGDKRCRLMERVLESIFVPCPNAKFGCTMNVTYGKGSIHEKECIFAQCSCPVLDCKYTGSYKDLYDHYLTHLERVVKTFSTYGTFFTVKMNISDKILVRREYHKGLLFVVQCFREPCAVYVTVSCIAPSSPEVGEFSYTISYTVDGHTMTYESPEVKMIRKVSFQTPKENFMWIPHSLLRGELLEMKVCINELS